jgi:hypothetical protein
MKNKIFAVLYLLYVPLHMMWGYMKAVVFHPVKAYRISLAVMEEDE